MDTLKEAVERALPALPDGLLDAVVDRLTEAGVEMTADLKYVEERDLDDILKPIQLRKLLHAWKDSGEYQYIISVDSILPW